MAEEKVKFDPGIGELVLNLNDFVNNVYSQLMSFQTIHQKRARFKLYATKIQKYIKNNIAFYLGCLLWAYYIYQNNINSPKEIEGNVFLNMPKEEKEKYDYMLQVNFIENYIDCFERDSLYYTGKKIVIPREWKNILELYIEFIELNKGFIDTKYTANIKHKKKIKEVSINLDINSLIKEVIKKEDLEILMNIDNLPDLS